MMYSQRFVVDILEPGKKFLEAIQQVFLPDGPVYEPDRQVFYNERIKEVFIESNSQIFQLLGSNLDEFCLNLLSYPNYQYFAHLAEFNVPEIRDFFSKAFREYGMEVMFSVHQAIGIKPEHDYILEQLFSDHILIQVIHYDQH